MKRALKRLDTVHQKLIETISTLAPDVYATRPAENEWSVAEIVHHLWLVEGRVTKELQTGIAGKPRRVSFLRRFMPTSIVSQRFIRVKAPKAVNPLNAPSREVALENFVRSRAELKLFCATHGEERLRNVIFKHPFLGEMDGVAALSFMGYHEKRHYKQIREVSRKLKKSAPASGE
jgi:hypothetical protein